MSWQEAIATVVVLCGLGAAAFLVAQRPSFWIEFGSRLIARLMPFVVRYVTRRMSPEDEERMRACIRRGGVWDNFRKRCRD